MSMFSGFSQQKLNMHQLFEVCKTINYVPPDKPLEQWTKEESYYGGLNIVIQQPILLRCVDFVCASIPPLKLFIKSTLKDYIKQYSAKKNEADKNV